MAAQSFIALATGLVTFIAASIVVLLIINRAISHIGKHSQLPKNSIRDVQRAIFTVWAALVAVWILQSLGVASIISSITLSGLIGLGITLALQSTLSSFFASLSLIQDHVLSLGDTIKIGDITGVVVKVSLRSTWIKTPEGHVAIVGNTTLSNGPFINYTAADRLLKK